MNPDEIGWKFPLHSGSHSDVREFERGGLCSSALAQFVADDVGIAIRSAHDAFCARSVDWERSFSAALPGHLTSRMIL